MKFFWWIWCTRLSADHRGGFNHKDSFEHKTSFSSHNNSERSLKKVNDSQKHLFLWFTGIGPPPVFCWIIHPLVHMGENNRERVLITRANEDSPWQWSRSKAYKFSFTPGAEYNASYFLPPIHSWAISQLPNMKQYPVNCAALPNMTSCV